MERKINTTEEIYNEYYYYRFPTPFGKKFITFWHQKMFDIAKRHIADFKKKTLLEAGTGWGCFSEVCRRNGLIDYIGVEGNKILAEEVSKKGFSVVCAYIPPFPKIERKVEIIWLSHILENAPDYLKARQILCDAYHALSNDGYIVVISPDILSWKNEFYNCDWSHGFPTTLRRVKQLLQDVGFSIVFSKHHVATLTNKFYVIVLEFAFRLLPVAICDYVLLKLLHRDFCYSFMTLFGWRQIYIIARKG